MDMLLGLDILRRFEVCGSVFVNDALEFIGPVADDME